MSNGKAVYFGAYTAKNGTELWYSEGLESSTKQLHDVKEGVESSNPSDFNFMNDDLFFVAETSHAGRQLWKTSSNMITSLEDFKQSEHLKIFPNPASDFLYFNTGKFQLNEVTVVNITGQKTAKRKIKDDKIYLGDLSPGIYMLIAQSGNKKISRRFIKQ